MNNLQIEKKDTGNGLIITCTGRLDANHAGHLNDYINNMVRDGHYSLSLDLDGVEYLSSAGIRTLVSQYKNLKSVNGQFIIASMSENVRQVLNMVGMEAMLCQKTEIQVVVPPKTAMASDQIFDEYYFRIISSTPEKNTIVELYGEPSRVFEKGFEPIHARTAKSEAKGFSIGLGAFGNSFDECSYRFGEYIITGKDVAYLPADGSQKPDFMQSSGQLVASVMELYGIHFVENHACLIHFEPQSGNNSISLSKIIENISKITGQKELAIVMVAESGGLVGASLNASPVENRAIFSYPEIKNTVNFTTEPAHNKMLTLSTGIFTKSDHNNANNFVRPLYSGAEQSGHMHSLVFPYTPLKKTNVDLYETIEFLYSNFELIDLLHLTNDNREISGLGESRFVQGFCWVTPILSINNITNR